MLALAQRWWTIHTDPVTFTAVFVPRRLDKYLRDSTALSVVEIRNACIAGRVSVCTADALQSTVPAADSLIFKNDIVTLDGQVIGPRAEHCYLVLNKPRAVTTTASDPDGRADLGPWLRQMPNGVFPVGRLDRETSGALLFTDDGDFSNAILQPDHHTDKLYWLWLDENLTDDDPRLLTLVSGVCLDKGSEQLRAVSATVKHRTLDYTELHVTLDEGKNRHIRKMCNLLGLRLLQLHRKAIGSLHIDNLAVGQWRGLNASEVEQLWSSCGGIARVNRIKIAALTQMAQSAWEAGRSNQRLEKWLKDTAPEIHGE
jgi:23S rRNA pseudouridine2605 synthase